MELSQTSSSSSSNTHMTSCTHMWVLDHVSTLVFGDIERIASMSHSIAESKLFTMEGRTWSLRLDARKGENAGVVVWVCLRLHDRRPNDQLFLRYAKLCFASV
jgi:hypothetical protein